jgi:hypothetical protein
MAFDLCLQDWVTISSSANSTVIQNSEQWLDIAGIEDLAIYCEIAQLTEQASVTRIDVQTAPVKEEAFFNIAPTGGSDFIARFQFSTSVDLGVQPIMVVRWSALTAASGDRQLPSRFLRWILRVGGAATSITFRLWLTGRQTGW